MPYVPAIRNYKPFYIQNGTDATAWDTTTYGLVAQTQPFPEGYEVKEPYKNDWKDEHGDDEYVAAMKFKAFEYTVKFYIKAYPVTTSGSEQSAIGVLNGLRSQFINKLVPGEFKIWDSWQEKGYQKVRFVKSAVEERGVTDESAWMIFSVTFKVNDPATAMTYDSTNQVITTVSSS